MATVRVTADETDFVLVSTATDFLVHNVGTQRLIYKFDTSLPDVDDVDVGVLAPYQGLQKISSVPAGNLYVKAIGVGKTAIVAVSE